MKVYQVSVEGEPRLCMAPNGVVFEGATHVIVKVDVDPQEPPVVVIAYTGGRDAYVGTLAINAALKIDDQPNRFKAGPIIP